VKQSVGGSIACLFAAVPAGSPFPHGSSPAPSRVTPNFSFAFDPALLESE